jgi:carboxypeptidase family protein
MRQFASCALVLLVLLTGAATSRAQSFGVIAGDVKDTAGALLPGVTVTVAGPALGEKTRAGTTDSAGHYSIGALPAGTYSVSFGLAGFKTSLRDGVMVGAFATATVNAELSVWTISPLVTGLPPTLPPSSRIVCGLTVLQGGSNVDPRMAQRLPPGAPKGIIGVMPAPMCQQQR